MSRIVRDFSLRAKEFLRQHWDQKSPLLLGYSGGPDSKALLYILLEAGVSPHIAHVDHGWREESRSEAEALRQEAETLGLPFYTTRLEPDRRESVAREKRLGFFASLFEQVPFQALLLAHQADDWAETALKRTLEGAHLVYLGGMKGVSEVYSIPIWRPLLQIHRRDVLAYLQSKGLEAIQDPTNFNPVYLRARMRSEILPALSRSFGKEVSANLVCLAERSQELREYLDRRTDAAIQSIQRTPGGFFLPPLLEERIEIRHALQRTGVSFTRTILEGVVDAIARRQPKRKFGQRMIADRGGFFYIENLSSTDS